MVIIHMLLLFSIVSCWASEEDITQQATKLFITKTKVVNEENPILPQAPDQQLSLYMKTAKKIVLEALKFDPMMTPKNIRRVEYEPKYKLKLPATNLVQPELSYAQIETVWLSEQEQPKIFLFYKDVGQQIIKGEAPFQQSIYSFNGKFYSSPLGMLDMTISPNGKYIAALTNLGSLEIRIMNEDSKDHEEFRDISLLKHSVNPNLKPTSGAVRWLNDGKAGYCVCGTELYEFVFDSFSDPKQREHIHAQRVGQFTTAYPQNVIIKNLSVESKFGDIALSFPNLFFTYSSPSKPCVIDYTQEGKENAFIYSTMAEQPEIYTVKTNLGDRSLILSSPNNLLHPGLHNKVENIITGVDIATARNFKNLENYDGVTVDEEHNVVYMFKHENQNKTNEPGFVPVLEYVSFVPDYIKDLVRDFNRSILALSRVQANVMHAEVVRQAVKDKLLLVKAEERYSPALIGTTALTNINSIDVNETAKDTVRKALIIYQKVLEEKSLLGPVLSANQGAIGSQTTAQQTQAVSNAQNAVVTQQQTQRVSAAQNAIVTQLGAPQSQGNLFQRLYGRASTWYTSLTNATKTRLKWLAGVMVTSAGALGLTWLYSKYNKGTVPAVYGKLPQVTPYK